MAEYQNFYILDGITGLLLALELHAIFSGLIRCFQQGEFAWYRLSSVIMMVLLLYPGAGPWLILTGFNLYGLCRKGKLYSRRVLIYRRTNALFIQVLFLACTAVSLIAMLDHARF